MCEISKNNFFYSTPLVAAARNLLGHVLTTVKTRVLTNILFFVLLNPTDCSIKIIFISYEHI